MGRGDKKSKRGKIAIGSFGNSRKRKVVKAYVKPAATSPDAAPKEEAKKKAPKKRKGQETE